MTVITPHCKSMYKGAVLKCGILRPLVFMIFFTDIHNASMF